MKRLSIAVRCPTCGKGTLKRVVRDVETSVGRRRLVVRDVELEECPKCGERVYDLTALRKLRAVRRQARGRRAA